MALPTLLCELLRALIARRAHCALLTPSSSGAVILAGHAPCNSSLDLAVAVAVVAAVDTAQVVGEVEVEGAAGALVRSL